MTLALLTFVLTLTIVVGSYWAMVVRPEAQLSGQLLQRLRMKASRPVGAASVVKGTARGDLSTGLVSTLVKWHHQYAVASAARLIESCRPSGFTVEVSGPWAPYSFTGGRA